MRITPLTHSSNTSVAGAAHYLMKLFFRKNRLSRAPPPDDPPATAPVPTPAIQPAYPAPASHGVQGTSAPIHPPPNASGYVGSHGLLGTRAPHHPPPNASGYTLHGGGAGNLYAVPVRPAAYGSSARHGSDSDVYRTPRSEHRRVSQGGPPANHINDTMGGFDTNREELFGGASRRIEQQHAPPQGLDSSAHGAYGASRLEAVDNVDYVPERQLTAEEEEEEDVEAVKSQIRFTKRQTVASTETALHAAAQAEESGRNTLGRLGTQGDSLQNTRNNLALASSHNRVAAEKTRELKKANGSMFAIHIKNPLRHAARAEAEEAEILAIRQKERAGREELSADGYESRSKIGRALNDTSGTIESRAKTSLAERARFQFEADESDDEMERQIGTNLESIADATGRLKGLAIATGREVDRQIVMVQGIRVESDQVEDQIVLNSNRLRRIR
ncbi:Protein transport protein S9 plasma membrane t-SNARE [Maublancomyces gigas]|uniref:Protein transport protein S9 plasma membrane t-SNARE n=1 Tax=Discina gigas TaxID=1032678 RepID=A0ABR3GMW8_9PEZI